MNKFIYTPNCTFQVIILDAGENVFIDTDDFERIKTFHWFLSNGYACTGHIARRMHHEVLGLTDFSVVEVHHKDDNKLNNCKYNLQVVTFQEHIIGRPKQSNNESGYKGVSWKKGHGNRKSSWCAQIAKDRKKIFIGRFSTPEDAARAYDKKAKELFGTAAYLNFPND